MRTLEINSINDYKKSIEIIIDGKSAYHPASFYAYKQPGNALVIKDLLNLNESLFINDLSVLKVNNKMFTSSNDAIIDINELVNFFKGGSSSENNGVGIILKPSDRLTIEDILITINPELITKDLSLFNFPETVILRLVIKLVNGDIIDRIKTCTVVGGVAYQSLTFIEYSENFGFSAEITISASQDIISFYHFPLGAKVSLYELKYLF